MTKGRPLELAAFFNLHCLAIPDPQTAHPSIRVPPAAAGKPRMLPYYGDPLGEMRLVSRVFEM